MRKKMIELLLMNLVKILTVNLTEDSVKEGLDSIFDRIEEIVSDTENAYDDAVIIPVLNALRSALDIPDYADEISTEKRNSTEIKEEREEMFAYLF